MFPLNHSCRTSEGNHSIHFNEESTKQFLRELKLSVGNISAMIVKEKQSLGIDTSTIANTNKDKSLITNMNAISAIDTNLHEESSFNLCLSIDMGNKSTTELAYSTSPNLVYQSGHQYFKMIDSGAIAGKLNFDDDNEEEKSHGKWRKEEKRTGIFSMNGMSQNEILNKRSGEKWSNMKNEENGNKYENEKREKSNENYFSEFHKPKQNENIENVISINKISVEEQKYFKNQLRNVEQNLKKEKEKMFSTNIKNEESERENTCCQNELENILALKSKTKNQGARNVEKSLELFLNSLDDQHYSHKSIASNLSPSKPKNLSQRKSKSPSIKPKSPFKSPKINKLKTPVSSKIATEKKLFFVDRKSPISGKVSPNKTTAYKERSNEKLNNERSKTKYSHASKSPKNKNSEVLELKGHLKTPKQQWDRKKFIEDMSKKGYIRSFLTVDELNILYAELESKEVPRFQWEEKVNERIFKKIHHTEDFF